MSQVLQRAAAIIPPAQPTKLVLVAATSSTAQGPLQVEAFYTFVCSSAFTIRFGASDVAAADADSWPVPANTPFPVLVTGDRTYFRAFSAAGGNLFYYVSG